jgi:hypothetical protein
MAGEGVLNAVEEGNLGDAEGRERLLAIEARIDVRRVNLSASRWRRDGCLSRQKSMLGNVLHRQGRLYHRPMLD